MSSSRLMRRPGNYETLRLWVSHVRHLMSGLAKQPSAEAIQLPLIAMCVVCRSLKQSFWVGSAGGMQVCAHEAEGSQPAWQRHKALKAFSQC